MHRVVVLTMHGLAASYGGPPRLRGILVDHAAEHAHPAFVQAVTNAGDQDVGQHVRPGFAEGVHDDVLLLDWLSHHALNFAWRILMHGHESPFTSSR